MLRGKRQTAARVAGLQYFVTASFEQRHHQLHVGGIVFNHQNSCHVRHLHWLNPGFQANFSGSAAPSNIRCYSGFGI
jgi:hypothetical protein